MQHPPPSIDSDRDDWQLKSRCDSGLTAGLFSLHFSINFLCVGCTVLSRRTYFLYLCTFAYILHTFLEKNIYVSLYIYSQPQVPPTGLCEFMFEQLLATVKFSVPVYTKCNLSTIREKRNWWLLIQKRGKANVKKLTFYKRLEKGKQRWGEEI